MRPIPWAVASVAALALSFLGCEGCDPPTIGLPCSNGELSCRADTDCQYKERLTCQNLPSDGQCCALSYRRCSNDSECCPGQTCSSGNRCFDKAEECTLVGQSSECSETGERTCENWLDPVLGSLPRCNYARCDENGACAGERSCFAGFCVSEAPCGGLCPDGEACTPHNNRCHPYGPRGDGCAISCLPGYLKTFVGQNGGDPLQDNVYDVCSLALLKCECVELPPLTSNDMGRHASLATTGSLVSVAFYDGRFGDLAVRDYDAAGAILNTIWVDGFPTDGTIGGAPSGPRNGVIEAGEDVGRYTSVAFGSSGSLHVAYYDVTHGDLRYVERAANGTWGAPYAVDGANADTGLFASLALDTTGKPAIAYFQRAGSSSTPLCATDAAAPGVLTTALRFVQAKSAHPGAASDWNAPETVVCAGRPQPPCFGCSTAGATKCVADSTSPSGTICTQEVTGCNPACSTSSGDVCVRLPGSSGPSCVKLGSPLELAGLPPGVGLFPSLAFKNGSPVVAFYLSTTWDFAGNRAGRSGNLLFAEKPGGAWSVALLDGFDEATGVDTTDAGMFPSLVVDASGTFHLAYHDFTERSLKYLTAPAIPWVSGAAPAREVIDDGVTPALVNGATWVGADVSLVVASIGTFAAYQNTTTSDLRLAKRGPGGWARVDGDRWTQGAMGFYASAGVVGSKLAIAHARIHARTVGGKPESDNTLLLEIYSP